MHKWSIGLLLALLIGSNIGVKYYKKTHPGKMSVIEAQSMDMAAMKPPTGAVPVATEVVRRGSFSAKVKYTGSVAPLTEQNIYPRVEGWLTRLNVYNGDRVRSGQLLAVLDSPDIQTRLSEATYGHAAASREISVAQSNLARMRAEKSAAQGGIVAAQRDLESTRARLNATQRMVSQIAQELKSARASLDYWKAEFKRQAALLKAGAVSQQEYDMERSQLIAAEAEVENKEAKVEEAKANVAAARAEVSNKEAEVRIARDMARAADAALQAASGEVKQKVASAGMAGAARATAATFNKYREIRAPFDGVVTKRLIHPGVLVNPGMAILNVVQIDRVRLQANVAEKDLGSVSLGAEVTAHTLKESRRTYQAYVTSVSPMADQTSRTAVVEALVDNRDHYLVPGDFVSMEIATASSIDAITVPSTALAAKEGLPAVWVVQYTGPKGKMTYYCTMHPEVTSDKPGDCPKCSMKLEPKQIGAGKTARLVQVTVGKTDGERTEILSGLKEGNEVIYAGHRYLREGDFVFPTKWGKEGPSELPPPPGGGAAMPGHSGHKSSAPETDVSVREHAGHDMSGGGTMKDEPVIKHEGHKVGPHAHKMEGLSPDAAAKAKSAGKQLYTCPMHPEFVTDNPKQVCPKCNMKLEPRKD